MEWARARPPVESGARLPASESASIANRQGPDDAHPPDGSRSPVDPLPARHTRRCTASGGGVVTKRDVAPLQVGWRPTHRCRFTTVCCARPTRAGVCGRKRRRTRSSEWPRVRVGMRPRAARTSVCGREFRPSARGAERSASTRPRSSARLDAPPARGVVNWISSCPALARPGSCPLPPCGTMSTVISETPCSGRRVVSTRSPGFDCLAMQSSDTTGAGGSP